ncbi:hypothetical protein TEA_015342 [Camellia sinensis var. sinensis]|uniref:Uncharacterized protein n=1 Tax=Camellia sinensis var. sinensis TaxID=542762 RepID=A0A4S4F493_CAMSN|nr:hypothetical protein TEA_015342 [Camellia sinensis var. sinensis]
MELNLLALCYPYQRPGHGGLASVLLPGSRDLKKQRRRVMPQKHSTEERVKPQKCKINKKIMLEQGKVEKRVKPLKHSKDEKILLKNNIEEKEQMMVAKLYENVGLITDILKGNLGESSDCLG